MPRLIYEPLRQNRYFKRLCNCGKMFRPRGKTSRLCDICAERQFLIGIRKRQENYSLKRKSQSKDGKGVKANSSINNLKDTNFSK